MNSSPVVVPAQTRASNAERLRIVLLGYIVRGPVGGMAWSDLHYFLGLAQLGHDVYFVEDSGESPWCCYDPSRHVTDRDPTYGLQFATGAFAKLGLADRWAYHDAHSSRWLGPCANDVETICQNADLLINLYPEGSLHPWLRQIPVRAFVDKDPAFRQVQHLINTNALAVALEHTSFFSFGENIADGRSAVPDDGLPWQATRHPIFLEAWPDSPGLPSGRFTTVMQWKSYAAQEFGGVRYGLKSDSFEPYMDLPARVGPVLELAIGGGAVTRLLRSKGWLVQDPLEAAGDPWAYQSYIQRSKGEFSVAKQGYVLGRTGWFSERSAAYLASGRPVLLQETGFSNWLPTGSGIIPFRTLEEAEAGIEEICRRYEYHCRVAREIAVEYFSTRKILTQLIQEAMNDTGTLQPSRRLAATPNSTTAP